MVSEARGGSSARQVEIGSGAAPWRSECWSARTAPSWGKPLTEGDYAALATSWITREIADAAMLRRVDQYEGREIVGQKGKRDCAGVIFPYYWPGDVSAFNYRIRRDNPDWTAGKDGKPKPQGKYLGPPNGAIGSSFRPASRWSNSLMPRFRSSCLKGKRKRSLFAGSPTMRQNLLDSFRSR